MWDGVGIPKEMQDAAEDDGFGGEDDENGGDDGDALMDDAAVSINPPSHCKVCLGMICLGLFIRT